MIGPMLFSSIKATLKFLIRRFRHDRTQFEQSQKRVHKGGGIVYVSHMSIYLSNIYAMQTDVF